MQKTTHSLEVVRKEYFPFVLVSKERAEQDFLNLLGDLLYRPFIYDIWVNEPNVIDLSFWAFDDLQSA